MTTVYYRIEEFDPDLGFWETDNCCTFSSREKALIDLGTLRKAWDKTGYKFRIVKTTAEVLDV